MLPPPLTPTLFPYTTLFRSGRAILDDAAAIEKHDAVADIARERDLVGDDDHGHAVLGELAHDAQHLADQLGVERRGDRKSTRLNSSHQIISYAVFCLKKKNK